MGDVQAITDFQNEAKAIAIATRVDAIKVLDFGITGTGVPYLVFAPEHL